MPHIMEIFVSEVKDGHLMGMSLFIWIQRRTLINFVSLLDTVERRVNKLDVDWTYLMMKVSQMRENNRSLEKILKIERTKERMEQKFMYIEILSTTREIEENPFFKHDDRLFRQFLENIGNCYQQHLMWNKQKISQLKPKKIYKSGDFRHVFGMSSRKKNFLENRTQSCFGHKKSEKTNDEISRKCQKTGFPVFRVFSAGKICVSNIGNSHILGITILHLCAKNQKNIMNQSREKLVTD